MRIPFALQLFALASLMIAAPSVAQACPDVSGRYRLPPAGQCSPRELPFTLPLYSETAKGAVIIDDGVADVGDGILEITQSGCEKIRLTVHAGNRVYGNEFLVPSEIRGAQTENHGQREVTWLRGSIFESPALKITHVYRSPHYVGGIFNGPIGPVIKTWLLSKKFPNGSLELFNKLDYSSFHHPYTSTCHLQPE